MRTDSSKLLRRHRPILDTRLRVDIEGYSNAMPALVCSHLRIHFRLGGRGSRGFAASPGSSPSPIRTSHELPGADGDPRTLFTGSDGQRARRVANGIGPARHKITVRPSKVPPPIEVAPTPGPMPVHLPAKGYIEPRYVSPKPRGQQKGQRKPYSQGLVPIPEFIQLWNIGRGGGTLRRITTGYAVRSA